MSTNDFRGFYMKVMAGLFNDHGMSSDEAEALWDKHRDLMVAAYEDGMGPAKASDMLATQDAREAHEPGTRWSKELTVAFNGEDDPNDKWAKAYEGQPLWDFFDDVTGTLPPDEAIECIPARYIDAFKDYCASYGIKLTESMDAVPPTNPRDIQNLVRKAFNESGASGFRLDIVRMGDKIIVYTEDPAGNDNIGVAWHIHFPGSSYSKVYGNGNAFYTARYAKDIVGEWGGKAEKTHVSADTADLEKYLVDEFKALQETINGGKR